MKLVGKINFIDMTYPQEKRERSSMNILLWQQEYMGIFSFYGNELDL
jgi:hypothetical protein